MEKILLETGSWQRQNRHLSCLLESLSWLGCLRFRIMGSGLCGREGINLLILHHSSGNAFFFFTLYIKICDDGDGVLEISRILKLRNQLLSQRRKKI